MKTSVVILLILLGLYWLFDHYRPLPLNHESFGLYQHNLHRIAGVAFLIAAVAVGFFWKRKNKDED